MSRVPFFPDDGGADLEIWITLTCSKCGANRVTITELPNGQYRAVWWARVGDCMDFVAEMTGTLHVVKRFVDDDARATRGRG